MSRVGLKKGTPLLVGCFGAEIAVAAVGFHVVWCAVRLKCVLTYPVNSGKQVAVVVGVDRHLMLATVLFFYQRVVLLSTAGSANHSLAPPGFPKDKLLCFPDRLAVYVRFLGMLRPPFVTM